MIPLSDIQSRQDINQFVDSFYHKILIHEELAPIFVDIAKVDLAIHLPIIKSYWAKLLFGDKSYQRHTMNIHRVVNSKYQFTEHNFNQWLTLFEATIDSMYAGNCAVRAKKLAATIAVNMRRNLAQPIDVQHRKVN
jgi:hemoglobin